MDPRPLFPVIAEEILEQAFAIAFDYIRRTRDLADVTTAQERLADLLVQLVQRGERHPLRLANLAIAAYEQGDDRVH